MSEPDTEHEKQLHEPELTPAQIAIRDIVNHIFDKRPKDWNINSYVSDVRADPEAVFAFIEDSRFCYLTFKDKDTLPPVTHQPHYYDDTGLKPSTLPPTRIRLEVKRQVFDKYRKDLSVPEDKKVVVISYPGEKDYIWEITIMLNFPGVGPEIAYQGFSIYTSTTTPGEKPSIYREAKSHDYFAVHERASGESTKVNDNPSKQAIDDFITLAEALAGARVARKDERV